MNQQNMKKITLVSLVLFVGIIGYIFGYALIAPTQQQQRTAAPSNVPTVSSQSAAQQVFTMTEVARHSTANSCYLVINNNVYDVSSYIDSHPGGREAITSRCGQEVSGIFAQIHSNRAWDLLAAYKIGSVATAK